MLLTLTCNVQDTLSTCFDMSIVHNKITEHTVWYDVYQWLKCNGTQGNAVPHLQFMAQSVPPPQIVIMLGKGTRPMSGAQT